MDKMNQALIHKATMSPGRYGACQLFVRIPSF